MWPRSSSLRQWQVYLLVCWERCFPAVFSSCVGRPVMPGIMVGLDKHGPDSAGHRPEVPELQFFFRSSTPLLQRRCKSPWSPGSGR